MHLVNSSTLYHFILQNLFFSSDLTSELATKFHTIKMGAYCYSNENLGTKLLIKNFAGNELCGYGVSAKLDSVQYGKDIIVLKNLVKDLYPDSSTRPKVLGPAGFYEEKWFTTFLETIGPEVIDGVTHHIYNLGSGM